MFDIAMNTKGAMDLSSMVQGGLAGGNVQSTSNMQQAPNMQPVQNMQSFQNVQPNQGMNMNQQSQMYQQPQYNQQSQQGGFNQQPQGNFNPQSQYNQQPQMQPQTPKPQPVAQVPIQQKQRPQGNGVHLKKGQKVALGAPGQVLSQIQVCLGWDVTDGRCDLDASAFMLDASNKVIGDDWFVFYGQTNSPDGSVVHSGDSQGAGVGDDEIITINLNQVNPQVQKIAFVVTINEALEQGLNFSMVQNAYVRVVDKSSGQEMNKFLLTDYYSNVTSMVVGEIYRHNGSWKFNAVGDGVAKDLAGLCEMYGVQVAD